MRKLLELIDNKNVCMWNIHYNERTGMNNLRVDFIFQCQWYIVFAKKSAPPLVKPFSLFNEIAFIWGKKKKTVVKSARKP